MRKLIFSSEPCLTQQGLMSVTQICLPPHTLTSPAWCVPLLYLKWNQQGPTEEHMDLCSVLHGSRDGRGAWGRMDTRIGVAESLCWPPWNYHSILNRLYSSTKLQVVEKTESISHVKKEKNHEIWWRTHTTEYHRQGSDTETPLCEESKLQSPVSTLLYTEWKRETCVF